MLSTFVSNFNVNTVSCIFLILNFSMMNITFLQLKNNNLYLNYYWSIHASLAKQEARLFIFLLLLLSLTDQYYHLLEICATGWTLRYCTSTVKTFRTLIIEKSLENTSSHVDRGLIRTLFILSVHCAHSHTPKHDRSAHFSC